MLSRQVGCQLVQQTSLEHGERGSVMGGEEGGQEREAGGGERDMSCAVLYPLLFSAK